MAARTRSDLDMILGVVLIVLGALALLDWVGLGWLVTVAAIVALVAGILMLIGTLRGSTVMAVVLVVIGALLLVPGFLLTALLSKLVETVAAVSLIILGALKLAGRW